MFEMEEWVGERWHRFITRHASNDFPNAVVELDQVRKSVGILFRALGGDSGLRIEAAAPRDYLMRQSLLQKIAGNQIQANVAWCDEESLRLPQQLAVYPEHHLNRELYLWLAMLAASFGDQQKHIFRHWGKDNQRLVKVLLDSYPALRSRYRPLVNRLLPLRPSPDQLSGDDAELERAIQQALSNPGSVDSFPRSNRAPMPVPLWLYPSASIDEATTQTASDATDNSDDFSHTSGKTSSNSERKQAEREDEPQNRDGLMLFRLENLFSWSEYINLERSPDDSEDDQAEATAADLDKITLSRHRDAKSGSIKLNLDLPSEANDDLPLGEGIWLPEWDWRKQVLQPDYTCLQAFLPRDSEPAALPKRLAKTARLIRSQFEMMHTQRCWFRAQPQGEELDLKSWVDFFAETRAGRCPEPGLYQTFRRSHRDLATLLLADLSMSTDAYVDNEHRVIDIIQDSLILVSEALHGINERFAVYGFSSVKRHQVRFMMLKNFQETYGDKIRGRLLAMRPGYYTRMGAAIRQATNILSDQSQSQRLLLILTDGKPNDIDHYEGRYGIEDTKQALLEAKRLGMQPFCITIDQQAEEYLPYLFGSNGFTMLQHPSQLPVRLPELYHQLTS